MHLQAKRDRLIGISMVIDIGRRYTIYVEQPQKCKSFAGGGLGV